MMTNIRIELTDEQRRQLARQINGTVKLFTRKELGEFVQGIVEGAYNCAEVTADPPEHLPCFTPAAQQEMPARYAEKYADKSPQWKAGWVRGWNQVAGVSKHRGKLT